MAPIQIQISVNGDEKRTLHIGRQEKFIGENVSHWYIVTGEEFPVTMYEGKPREYAPNWAKGFQFEHVYADGLMTCVRKGIQEFEKHYKS